MEGDLKKYIKGNMENVGKCTKKYNNISKICSLFFKCVV